MPRVMAAGFVKIKVTVVSLVFLVLLMDGLRDVVGIRENVVAVVM